MQNILWRCIIKKTKYCHVTYSFCWENREEGGFPKVSHFDVRRLIPQAMLLIGSAEYCIWVGH